MPRIVTAAALAAAAMLASVAAATAQTPTQDPTAGDAGYSQRLATFVGRDGAAMGTVRLTPLPHGVLFELDLQGLPASGWHGFHIHETGKCDAAGGFESAGGHFTLAGTDHGLHVQTGPHAGDMPNQYAGADGVLRAQVFNGFVQLDGPNASDLGGRALVLHARPDDYESQPSGGSGERIACAVIE